jgi:hypothetical protein
MDAERLMREERTDFAAFLATLTPQQWQAPTLCAQWRVRDVVAHVVSYDNVNVRGLLSLAARGRFRLSRISATALARYNTSSPEQLVALLNDHPKPRAIPAALLTALRTAMIAPDVAGPWRIRGLRLVATDLGYSAGVGPEVRGAAEPLLMAIAGRPAALSELSGAGKAKLARRVRSR